MYMYMYMYMHVPVHVYEHVAVGQRSIYMVQSCIIYILGGGAKLIIVETLGGGACLAQLERDVHVAVYWGVTGILGGQTAPPWIKP